MINIILLINYILNYKMKIRIQFEIRLKFNNDFYRKMIKIFCKRSVENFQKLKLMKPWNSINESYFVCGYGSTALLEAAMLNVPSVQIATNDLLYGKRQQKSKNIKPFKLIFCCKYKKKTKYAV